MDTRRPDSSLFPYWRWFILLPLTTLLFLVVPGHAAQAVIHNAAQIWPWWVWPIVLFGSTVLVVGLSVVAGIGGSVLFITLVSGIAPFTHIDFIRGAGILVALTGALTAGPKLMQQGVADLRLAMPLALLTSTSSIFGAMVGLSMPATLVQITLGMTILVIAVLIWFFRPSEEAREGPADPIAARLGLEGRYWDATRHKEATWRPRFMLLGFVLFAVAGFLAGMFGLGAGWAYVPVLNLVMGLPLRFSVAVTFIVLAIQGPSAALVYLTRGALVPIIAVPAVLGSVVGAKFGAWLLVRLETRVIRTVLIIVLILSGLRTFLRGFGI